MKNKLKILSILVFCFIGKVVYAANPIATSVCSPLGRLKDDIQGAFNLCKIIVPIVVVVFSIYDFIKAMAGKVEGDIKKAFQKLVKRIVFAVIFFFIPDLLDYILGLVDPGYNTCINA